MRTHDYLQLTLFFAVLFGSAPFLGRYIANIFTRQDYLPLKWGNWLERFIYKLGGVNAEKEMTWIEYLVSLLMFNLFGFILLYFILIFQQYLPFNPQHFKGMSWHLALNTAVSFVTNTNWQSYSGEATLSYFSQMAGLTTQNFVSAATGIAAMIALFRGFTRKTTREIGNFWSDMTKTVLYVLLPLAIVVALLLVGQGVVQTLSAYRDITSLDGQKTVIPLGPAASQIAIKQLGTNGGGFFGQNSAHPFENPTPFSNFLELLSIILIPVALVFTFGKMVGSQRQGMALFLAMLILFALGLGISLAAEFQYNPVLRTAGSLEGKELRFGIMNSVLWMQTTTVTSNGSVNAMHDSMSPLAGGMAMLNIMLGEIVFGGVGSGMYGMLMYVVLTVFIAGLMVGRTPEYLGKKIEKREVQMAMLAIIAPNFIILIFSAIATSLKAGLGSLSNAGPHGLSEILYAFSSAAGNNGSAFAGLAANTPFYDSLMAIGMLLGRYLIIVPVLAVAGSLAEKKLVPESAGTFRTDDSVFVVLLIFVIVIVGALTHFLALTLGPVAEHFLMLRGITF